MDQIVLLMRPFNPLFFPYLLHFGQVRMDASSRVVASWDEWLHLPRGSTERVEIGVHIRAMCWPVQLMPLLPWVLFQLGEKPTGCRAFEKRSSETFRGLETPGSMTRSRYA